MPTSSDKSLVPIFIGVTGHRDLIPEEEPALIAKVEAIIRHVKEICPNSPLKIISPLAEGADRLIAKVGLSMGISLISPLPMTRFEYLKDFDTDRSKKEFEELLARAESVFELPFVPGNTPENIIGYNENRNKQYAQVGAYIAEHSQILIALWDGNITGKTGGTQAVIEYKLKGVPEPYAKRSSLLDVSDNGPVYHVKTRRVREEGCQGNPDCLSEKNELWTTLYPLAHNEGHLVEAQAASKAREHFEGILKKIDSFNKDSQEIAPSLSLEGNFKKLSGSTPDFDRLKNTYACADALAMKNQKMTHKALERLIGSFVLAFFFFGVFDELWSNAFLLLLFPVILGTGYLYQQKISNDHETKYLDYRALAEGLRVQIYWKYLHTTENVYECYLRKYKGEVGWISQAMRNVSLHANIEIMKAGIKKETKEARLIDVSEDWINDQNSYYSRKINDKKNRLLKQGKTTKFFFLAALLLVTGFFVIKGVNLFNGGALAEMMNLEDVKEWGIYSFMLVLIDTSIAIGAAYQMYVEKMAFSEEVKQFQRMENLYRRGSNIIKDLNSQNRSDEAEKILIEIGKEAVYENADWLLLKRSRPLEMPIG